MRQHLVWISEHSFQETWIEFWTLFSNVLQPLLCKFYIYTKIWTEEMQQELPTDEGQWSRLFYYTMRVDSSTSPIHAGSLVTPPWDRYDMMQCVQDRSRRGTPLILLREQPCFLTRRKSTFLPAMAAMAW